LRFRVQLIKTRYELLRRGPLFLYSRMPVSDRGVLVQRLLQS
jgi:hypothetical protein